MPYLKSTYKRPFYLFHHHLETIIPSLFRKVEGLHYQRERIDTEDGDFLDLDWAYSKKPTRRLAFISHGLEGSSQSQYARGMSRAFNRHGWDALVWNYRACSGELNLLASSYHSGATHDLEFVLNHVLEQDKYDEIVMFGFSLGGNMVLKFLGEQGDNLPSLINRAIIYSTPLHLSSCAEQMQHWNNFVYSQRFLKTLREKVREKAKIHPGKISLKHLKYVNSIRDFDDYYTAPLHGFEDAEDYYEQCSALHFLDEIRIPTLIINARNDSFLTNRSYPIKQFSESKNLYLEVPKTGGHCGFAPENKEGLFWSELRALQFIGIR